MQKPTTEITQGEILISDVNNISGKFKALHIALGSKHADVIDGYSEDGYPFVRLYATEDTVSINEAEKGKITEIKFTDYKGWRILTAHIYKYEMLVVLRKV